MKIKLSKFACKFTYFIRKNQTFNVKFSKKAIFSPIFLELLNK